MAPKRKAGRQPKGDQSNEGAAHNREQELEAQVEGLQKELRMKESAYQERLRNANTVFDTNHYYEVLDKVEQLQQENEQLNFKLNERSNIPDDEGQENSAAEHNPTFEPVIVLPKELRPSRDDHTLQLIDQYTSRKEELLQRKERAVKAQQETTAAIDMTKRRIHEINRQALSARKQGVELTQAQVLRTHHGPQETPTSGKPFEPSFDGHLPLEPPPPLNAYPVLTSHHPSTHSSLSFPMSLDMYSEVGHNAGQTLKFVRFKNGRSPEQDKVQDTTESEKQENEQEAG